jgi:hypothetical protein
MRHIDLYHLPESWFTLDGTKISIPTDLYYTKCYCLGIQLKYKCKMPSKDNRILCTYVSHENELDQRFKFDILHFKIQHQYILVITTVIVTKLICCK